MSPSSTRRTPSLFNWPTRPWLFWRMAPAIMDAAVGEPGPEVQAFDFAREQHRIGMSARNGILEHGQAVENGRVDIVFQFPQRQLARFPRLGLVADQGHVTLQESARGILPPFFRGRFLNGGRGNDGGFARGRIPGFTRFSPPFRPTGPGQEQACGCGEERPGPNPSQAADSGEQPCEEKP